MRKRMLLVVVALAVVGVTATAAIVSASQASKPITKQQVLHVKEVTTAFHSVVNQGPAGPSAGDEAAITTLFMQKGKVIGRNAITCTFTTNAVAYCSGAGKLQGGELTFQVRVGTAELLRPGGTFRFAITGGTGMYQNVSGYGVSTIVSQRVARDTLYINP